MSIWFVHVNERTGFDLPARRINLETEPCPAVMAGGIDADCCSHYWLEENGVIIKRPTQPDKPRYAIPSMADVAKLRGSRGYSVVSTFSGCGGSCLGFEWAGYQILMASEFVPAAQATYRANHPGVFLDVRAIRELTAEQILSQTGRERGDIDVLEGSPPCAAFSSSGRRDASWGKVRKYSDSDTKQRVDDLFFEFARLVDGVRPRVFVAENVSGLVKGRAKGYFKQIFAKLAACGYRVEARMLDAQWLGVPQSRQRLIFIGVRDDLGLEPAFPSPLAYRYSVRDAIPGITAVHGNKERRPTRRSPNLPAPTVLSGNSRNGRVDGDTDISDFAIGVEWDRLAPGKKGRYLNLIKPVPSEPCPSITAAGGGSSTASVVHPSERRKFTIPELRRICGFPDDFVLTGTYAQQWERLGRAVPPPMMRAVAETIATQILDRLPGSGRKSKARTVRRRK